MSNILLVDSDEVARMAMSGIVARGGHRFAAVESVAEAWEFLRSNVAVDLVFLELKLKGDKGLSLVQGLKEDMLLRSIPLVVYTGHADRDSVRESLELHVQNILIKPFSEAHVFAEIAKAASRPWLPRFFESPESELKLQQRVGTLTKLGKSLAEGQESIGPLKLSPGQSFEPIVTWLRRVQAVSKKAGIEGLVELLDDLAFKVSDGKWPTGDVRIDPLGLASRMIVAYLDPSRLPEGFLSEQEKNAGAEAKERTFWTEAAVEDRCPVIGWEQLTREMDNLSSCPVVDTISASFQMSATGHPTSLAPLLELVQKDPSLIVQVLISANRLKKKEEDGIGAAIEDPSIAIGMLGENRLASLGTSFETVEGRFLTVSPRFNWPAFSLFQLGTARMAQFICEQLEMHGLVQVAYTAGLMHDFGKILLARLHPYALPAIQEHANRAGISLIAAERFYIGCTSHEMAAYFAEKQDLPKSFCSVLRWINEAEKATSDHDLVAVVALARDLCLHNHVGFNGETSRDDLVPLESTQEWEILRKRAYLNFDLKRFERLAHGECLGLSRELVGKLS